MIFSIIDFGFWARDLLKCPTLRTSWKSPYKHLSSWWENLMVSLLKGSRYSRSDSIFLWQTWIDFTGKKRCIILLLKSWWLVIKNFRRLMYQLKVASFNVFAFSLHFLYSISLMMDIRLLTVKICSRWSLLPPKVLNDRGLRLFGTWSSQILGVNGYGLTRSSNSLSFSAG